MSRRQTPFFCCIATLAVGCPSHHTATDAGPAVVSYPSATPAQITACEAQLSQQWATSPPVTGLGTTSALASYAKVIGQLMATWQIPGGAISVTQHGRLVLAMGIGFAETGTPQPVNPDNRFRIASLTKQMTATAILKLVEAGQLSLTDKPFQWLNALQPVPGTTINPELASITIKNLLQHTGGWNSGSEAVGDPMFQSKAVAAALGVAEPVTAEDTIRFMLDKPLTYLPGATMCYSNFGYNVLGRVIEHVAGMPYADYVQSAVLAPQGATRTILGQTLPQNRADEEVSYYSFPGEALANSVFPGTAPLVPWPYGGWIIEEMDSHGGWITTPMDLLRVALGEDGLPSPPDILSSASESAMLANPMVSSCTSTGGTTPASSTDWYGFGWEVNSSANHWHLGSLDGTSTEDVTASNGFSWSAFFNSRPSDSNTFGSALDAELWTALEGAGVWSQEDLFDQYGAFSSWMDPATFQTMLSQQSGAGNYPSRLEGSVLNGAAVYRAEFVPLHPGHSYEAASGLNCVDYQSRVAAHATDGWGLVTLQVFVDGTGVRRYQATWESR